MVLQYLFIFLYTLAEPRGCLPQTPQFQFCQGKFQSCSAYFYTHLSRFQEKVTATQSSTLAWKISWTEEPGRLQSMGSLRVGHEWVTSFSLFTFMHGRRKEMATHSSVLAWRIPGTVVPGGLPSMGLHRVNWSNLAAAAAAASWFQMITSIFNSFFIISIVKTELSRLKHNFF